MAAKNWGLAGSNKTAGVTVATATGSTVGTAYPQVGDKIVVCVYCDNINALTPNLQSIAVSGGGAVGSITYKSSTNSPASAGAGGRTLVAKATVTTNFTANTVITATLSASVTAKCILALAATGEFGTEIGPNDNATISHYSSADALTFAGVPSTSAVVGTGAFIAAATSGQSAATNVRNAAWYNGGVSPQGFVEGLYSVIVQAVAGTDRFATPADTAAGSDSVVTELIPPLPNYQTYDEAVVGDGAVNYWKWDDPSGNVVADSIGSIPLTFIAGGTRTRNAAKIAPGLGPSTSMLADGNEADGAAIGGPYLNWTYEEWLFPITDMSSGIQNLGNFFAILQIETVFGGFGVNISGAGTVGGSFNPLPNVASHLAISVTPTMVDIYINGVRLGGGAISGALGLQNNPRIPLSERPWEGRISNVAVYPTALKSYQVKQHYDLGMASPPQNLVANPSDTAAGSDSATSVYNRAKTPGDTAGAVDAVTNPQGLVRTPADTAAGADALTDTQDLVRTPADTAAGTDAATPVQTIDRQPADTAGGIDSATSVLSVAANVLATPADMAAGADTATPVQTLDRTGADTAAGADSATDSQDNTRTAADLAGATDAATELQDYLRTSADTAAGADSATELQDYIRPAADLAGATDTATKLQGYSQLAIDTATGSDTWTPSSSSVPSTGWPTLPIPRRVPTQRSPGSILDRSPDWPSGSMPANWAWLTVPRSPPGRTYPEPTGTAPSSVPRCPRCVPTR